MVMLLDLLSGGRVACVARVSVGLRSKERPRKGIFGILPAQNCPFLARAKHRKRLIFARKKTQKIPFLAPQPHGNARGPEIKSPSLLLDGLVFGRPKFNSPALCE